MMRQNVYNYTIATIINLDLDQDFLYITYLNNNGNSTVTIWRREKEEKWCYSKDYNWDI